MNLQDLEEIFQDIFVDPELRGTLLASLLGIVLCFAFAVLVHEAGHAIVGRLAGYRLRLIRVGQGPELFRLHIGLGAAGLAPPSYQRLGRDLSPPRGRAIRAAHVVCGRQHRKGLSRCRSRCRWGYRWRAGAGSPSRSPGRAAGRCFSTRPLMLLLLAERRTRS